MEQSTMLFGVFLAISMGVASHQFYFKVGEHHMYPVLYLQIFGLAFIAAVSATSKLSGISLLDALRPVSSFALSYLGGVYGSLLIYRLFFHPLKNFPGPWQARISCLWLSFRLGGIDAYKVMDKLHEQYGQYVRIGSNDLSITDPKIMALAYGPNSRVSKGDWYDGSLPHQSMHTTRSKDLHDRRRRVWAPAFSDKALRSYEPTVLEFNQKLTDRIREFNGGPVNMTKWFNLYGFDVMGNLAFGKNYGMLDTGERHWALDIMVEGMMIAGFKLPCWLVRIMLAIPGLAAGYYRFLDFCAGELKWRVDQSEKLTRADITAWLLEAYGGDKRADQDDMLQGDARLIIVAGSDTTSAALTYLFYRLASDPSQVQKLRDELRAIAVGDWCDKDIQNASHLNGAINETLRLHPPVPSGLHRLTPKEGLQVGETYVPGDVHFWTPMYSMGRDERIYTDAESFVPERWYSKPDMIKHSDAFAPFSMGPFGCIGKALARMEIRTLTTQLILNYDVAFAPNDDGSQLINKTLDHFTTTVGDLHLVFTPAST